MLNEDYELTLLFTGKDFDTIETSLFKEVIPLKVEDSVLDINPIRHNDCGIVYFPEISAIQKSLWLANLRIAAIQIAGFGYPMSTFGAAID